MQGFLFFDRLGRREAVDDASEALTRQLGDIHSNALSNALLQNTRSMTGVTACTHCRELPR